MKFLVNLTRQAIQSTTVIVDIPDNEVTENVKQQAWEKAVEKAGDAEWTTDDAELIDDVVFERDVFEDFQMQPFKKP